MKITVKVPADPEVLARLDGLEAKLDRVLTALRSVARTQGAIVADLTALSAAVEENSAVDQSAIALLEGLADQIEAMSTDPAAIEAFAADLRSSSASLAAAVAANTPAGEPPVPPEA